MKWLDMYAKVAPDLVQSTARGGLFSLIAAGLMVWMLVVETWVFLGTGPVREKIDLELDLATELRMNVDLTFPNLACGDLTVELWRTTVRSQPRGMEKTLRVSAYNPASKRKKRYERIVGDDKSKGSEGFTGCEVEGFINAYNSPGSLKISAPANANLSHTVNAFSFGLPLNRDQSRQLSKLSAKYRAVNEATLRDATYHYHANDKVFHHFIHVVPTKRGGPRPPLEKRRHARVPFLETAAPFFRYQLHSNKAFMAYQTLHQSRPGQEEGDPTSLQRGCLRSKAREKSMARFEFAPGDDRSSKNEPSRVESNRDTRF